MRQVIRKNREGFRGGGPNTHARGGKARKTKQQKRKEENKPPRKNAPQEQVVGVGREAAVLKQPQQVIVLAVDVAADFNGGLQL